MNRKDRLRKRQLDMRIWAEFTQTPVSLFAMFVTAPSQGKKRDCWMNEDHEQRERKLL